MSKNLISLERAGLNLGNVTVPGSQDNTIDAMIAAASAAIRKYCKRDFSLGACDEVYNGNGDRRLLLRQYPIQSVESVRYRPVTVLKVTNTLAANVQARVAVWSNGIQLVSINAGVKTTVPSTTLSFASYPTLTSMANAITAQANGWSAQVVGDSTNYGSWASADLYWTPMFGDGLSNQGSMSTVVGSGSGSFAELKMHTYELQGFQFDSRGWLLRAIPYTDPELLHPEDLIFPYGINNFRIQYTAGYATIPEDVQEACAEWTAELYWMSQRDPAATSVALQSSVSTAYGKAFTGSTKVLSAHPSDYVRRLLAPYRRHTAGIGSS
jgi:hypothetical protein